MALRFKFHDCITRNTKHARSGKKGSRESRTKINVLPCVKTTEANKNHNGLCVSCVFLPVCPIKGGEGSLISGSFGGESWKVRLHDSPLDVEPAGERERPSISLQSSGDFLI